MANRGSIKVDASATNVEKEQFLHEQGGVATPSSDFVLMRGGYEYTYTGVWFFAKSYDSKGKYTGRKFLVLQLRCIQTGELVQWYPTSVRKTLPALIGVQCPGSFAKQLREVLSTDAVINGTTEKATFNKDEILPVGAVRADGTVVADETTKVSEESEEVTIIKNGNYHLLEWLTSQLKDKKMRAITILYRHVVVENGVKKLSQYPKQLVGCALEGADDYDMLGEEDMSDSI